MAVSVGDLALDLRIITDDAAAVPAGQSAILARHLGAAEALVSERTSGAPDALRDAAVLAIASYAYDRPTAGGGSRYASAWRNSGAAEILSAYIRRRAVVIGGPQTAAARAAPGPVQPGAGPTVTKLAFTGSGSQFGADFLYTLTAAEERAFRDAGWNGSSVLNVGCTLDFNSNELTGGTGPGVRNLGEVVYIPLASSNSVGADAAGRYFEIFPQDPDGGNRGRLRVLNVDSTDFDWSGKTVHVVIVNFGS